MDIRNDLLDPQSFFEATSALSFLQKLLDARLHPGRVRLVRRSSTCRVAPDGVDDGERAVMEMTKLELVVFRSVIYQYRNNRASSPTIMFQVIKDSRLSENSEKKHEY